MQSPANIAALRANLRGQVIQPSDHGYDAARALYNGMIDKRPLVIARCSDVADVMSAVIFGRDNLLIAIRGGGHSGPGLSSCDGGLVIDLSAMKGVRVDPTSTVRVEPGCTQGDVDHVCHAFGLAVPAGTVSTTGIAGLTRWRNRIPNAQARSHHRQPSRGRCRARRRQLRHGERHSE